MTRSPTNAKSFDTASVTVTQLTRMVKRAIEQQLPRTVHVVGEISNFKRHSSGHLYFVLKDESSELGCVMWRATAATLKFDPVDGLEVLATGNVDVFERSGRYQLYVRRMEPKGVGALELAFRQLCEKLEREGLFDPRHKQPLPRFPERIAIVTSPTGAAVRDILQTLKRRYPGVEVFIYPVTVQGPTAAGEIAKAIEVLNARRQSLGGIDVMIVGRGGGSLEDLWAFNEEVVARAIFASRIPIVSAVGHEVDVSISDLVADVRAATPTAAGELVVPLRDELLESLSMTQRRLTRVIGHVLELRRASLNGILQRGSLRDPLTLVRRREQVIDELVTRLRRRAAERLHGVHRILSAMEVTLQRIKPDAFAARMHKRLSDVAHRLSWSQSRRLAGCQDNFADVAQRLRWSQSRRLARCQRELADVAQRLRWLPSQGLACCQRKLADVVQRLRWSPSKRLARYERKFADVAQRLRWSQSQRLARCQRKLADASQGFNAVSPAHGVLRMKDRVESLCKRLDALSHKATLRRGFTITRRKKSGSVVRDIGQLVDDDVVTTETADGSFESRVVNLKQMELFD